MSRVAYILLCHKEPEIVVSQVKTLTQAGDFVAIHYDARAKQSDHELIQEAFRDDPNVTFPSRREKCGWGEWSLVQATLNALEAAEEAFPRASHFFLVSGDCVPIKSAKYMHNFLDARDVDYIEINDFFASNWIKTGMKDDRLIYRHFFNERTSARAFYWSYWLQKRLRLTRKVPEDLTIQIGSQWWCLRRLTVEKLLEFTRARKDVMRFFKTTWIPDETFFQTLVRKLVPNDELVPHNLTFLMFSDYGMPVVFYEDHYDMLCRQDALFARKVSADAKGLRAKLKDLYISDEEQDNIADDGRSLFRFLTTRGRTGQRFGSPFWDRFHRDAVERRCYVILCKKWHVAKRIAESIARETGLNGFEYIFSETEAKLPDLGGLEHSLEKRSRHRRSFLDLLYRGVESDEILFCADPSSLDILEDLQNSRLDLRLLLVETNQNDDYMRGHASRIGFADAAGSALFETQILPTLRTEFAQEVNRIKSRGFPHLAVLNEDAQKSDNQRALGQFLGIDNETAAKILGAGECFAD